MQTLLQLNPPIPLKTPLGDGLAVLVTDHGSDQELSWTVIINKGDHAGEILTYANSEVRGVDNLKIDRRVIQAKSPGLLNAPEPLIGPHPGEKGRPGPTRGSWR